MNCMKWQFSQRIMKNSNEVLHTVHPVHFINLKVLWYSHYVQYQYKLVEFMYILNLQFIGYIFTSFKVHGVSVSLKSSFHCFVGLKTFKCNSSLGYPMSVVSYVKVV